MAPVVLFQLLSHRNIPYLFVGASLLGLSSHSGTCFSHRTVYLLHVQTQDLPPDSAAALGSDFGGSGDVLDMVSCGGGGDEDVEEGGVRQVSLSALFVLFGVLSRLIVLWVSMLCHLFRRTCFLMYFLSPFVTSPLKCAMLLLINLSFSCYAVTLKTVSMF